MNVYCLVGVIQFLKWMAISEKLQFALSTDAIQIRLEFYLRFHILHMTKLTKYRLVYYGVRIPN